MTSIVPHLSVEALRERYLACTDAREARHFQPIWLLAKGHRVGEVSQATAFGVRWIEQLVARYNAHGPSVLGDLRRDNGSFARILTPQVLDKLRVRLQEPPDDGGLWTSVKVAAFLAGELGLEKVAPQRGWEALKAIGWSIQKPRPKNPRAATPEEEELFKKASPTWSLKKRRKTPNEKSRFSLAMNIGSV